MSVPDRPVLVLGATGRQGGAVARALTQAGWRVTALVRQADMPAAAALRTQGVDVRQGSFADADALCRAMHDTYGVFSVLPANLPEGEEVRIGSMIADLAVEAGVEHFVYSSGASVGHEPTGVPRFDAKPRIEAHVRSLPLVATIVRPMIFMEFLLGPDLGLDQGRYAFFVRADQAMQVVAVNDIGALVAAVFADRARFGGQTIKLASDTVTGRDLEKLLSRAAGRPIRYERFPDSVLAAQPDLAHMARSLECGPLSEHVDLSAMRAMVPALTTFGDWLDSTGRPLLQLRLKAGRD